MVSVGGGSTLVYRRNWVQGSKHTVVTMVTDEGTTSGPNVSLQQRYYLTTAVAECLGTATNTTITTNPTS